MFIRQGTRGLQIRASQGPYGRIFHGVFLDYGGSEERRKEGEGGGGEEEAKEKEEGNRDCGKRL